MSNILKYVFVGIMLLVMTAIVFIAYRMFFQFDSKAIRTYAQEEAKKYSDPVGVYNIIMYGVEHILSSYNLTNQVLNSASATKTDKEQELVNAAVNQCKAYQYLPA